MYVRIHAVPAKRTRMTVTWYENGVVSGKISFNIQVAFYQLGTVILFFLADTVYIRKYNMHIKFLAVSQITSSQYLRIV